MTAPTTPVTASTEYVVLGLDGSGFWTVLEKQTARDPKQAVKGHASGSSEAYVEYVAVPARSWNPVKVSKKIETTFVVEDVA